MPIEPLKALLEAAHTLILNFEASRLLTPLPNLPHLQIGRFDAAPEPVSIEQRMRWTVRVQPAPIACKKGRITRQLQRQRFVRRIFISTRRKTREFSHFHPATMRFKTPLNIFPARN